jgi:hypothetical protein
VSQPGPNNFSIAFFQDCWVLLKEDIMKDFRDLHTRGKFEKRLNATFIALIPKTPVVVNLKDFCSISLVRAFTKLLLRY